MKGNLVIFMLVACVGVSAKSIPLPNDLPTIEALIHLHKTMKNAEDKACEKIGISYGEQTTITNKSNKYNDVKTTLNSKLNNVYSYIVFAGAISTTAKNLYDLINEYRDFSTNACETFFKKPMATWYYLEANYALAKEIRNIKKMMLTLSAEGFNLMRSSMDEKLFLINTISASISTMRHIIDRAYWWCSLVVNGGFNFMYIWDILNSEVTDAIAHKLICNWRKELLPNPQDQI